MCSGLSGDCRHNWEDEDEEEDNDTEEVRTRRISRSANLPSWVNGLFMLIFFCKIFIPKIMTVQKYQNLESCSAFSSPKCLSKINFNLLIFIAQYYLL